MPMDLVQLRTFVAVAEEQHLTRAADRLAISQSAASAHVRAVEDMLDTKLFVRASRSLELTRAGQLLLQKAKALLTEDAQFMSFARNLRGKLEGKLVVGTSSEAGTRIGEIMTALREAHPLINVNLLARPSSGARRGLQSGELDVAVMLDRPVTPDFTYYHLTNVPYRVAGPAAWRDTIVNADWAALAQLPWLTPNSSSAHSSMLNQLFGDMGLELNSVIQFDSASVGRAALMAGAGMLLLREEHALQGEKDGLLAVSPIARAEIGLHVAHKAGRKGDPLIEAFVAAASMAWPDMKQVRPQDLRPAQPGT